MLCQIGRLQPIGRNHLKLLGFNGKENDNELLGEGHLQDYGFRPYLPALGRFFSVYPLTQKYPELTPYQFASNRPVDGVDLDGLEWAIMKNKAGGITLSVNVNLRDQSGLSSSEIRDYKQAISNQLDMTMKESFGSNYSGIVTFNPTTRVDILVPSLTFMAKDGRRVGGNTLFGNSTLPVLDGNQENSGGLPANVVGQSAIHELFHTVRLNHPFEQTDVTDTELIQIGENTYESASFATDFRIDRNIMNYSGIDVNGQIHNKSSTLILLTPGQLRHIENEIAIQKQGVGSISQERSTATYFYWREMREKPDVKNE